jgi:hypothetical protein
MTKWHNSKSWQNKPKKYRAQAAMMQAAKSAQIEKS